MELDDVRQLGDYDTVTFKTGSAVLSSYVIGTITGAVAATWKDIPAIERNQALPALLRTARVMNNYGLYFAAVGGTFALADAVAQEARGKKDLWNGVVGGLTAGAIVGLRASSVPVGIGAGAALAALAATVDASGHVSKTPTNREYLPFRK